MTLTESNSNATTLTKSQKKRMKRNKAKQRKAEATPVSTIPENSLNPLDKLRSGLTSMGFDLAVVDKSMDEMWNLQLDYSDFDSVLAYMQSRAEETEEAVIEQIDNVDKAAVAESITDSTLNSSPSSPSLSSKQETEAVNGSAVNAAIPEPVREPQDPIRSVTPPTPQPQPVSDQPDSTTQSTPPAPSVPAPQLAEKKPRGKPITLNAKLETVATSEELNDGIITLTEWVTKAATSNEIVGFCSVNKCKALQIVIQRSILSGNTNSTGQLLDLTGSILRQVGVPSSDLLSSAKALGLLIRRASGAIDTTQHALNQSIAQSVSENVVTAIGDVVKQMTETATSPSGTIKRLNSEIQQLQSSIKTKSNAGIMDLMTKRDKCKSIAEKVSTIIQLTMNNSPVNNIVASLNKPDISKTTVISNILGSQYDDVMKSKATYEQLKSRQGQSNSSFSERDTVTLNLNSLNADKTRIARRQVQLMAELDQLKVEEKQVEVKIQQQQTKLSTLEGSLSKEAKEVDSLLTTVSQKMKIEESVSSVAQQVCEFANAMDTITSSQSLSAVTEAETEVPSVDANALGSLLAAYRRYFSSELETISYLKQRSNSIQTQIPNLLREIEECEALGMSSTVADMKKKEKEMRTNVTDDNLIVEAFVGEADVTRLTTISQLAHFRTTPAFNSEEVENYAATLKEINEVFVRIGLPRDGKWTNIMTDYGITSASTDSAPGKTTSASPLPKKTGWNIAGTGGGGLAKSLVDIQKEELGSGYA